MIDAIDVIDRNPDTHAVTGPKPGTVSERTIMEGFYDWSSEPLHSYTTRMHNELHMETCGRAGRVGIRGPSHVNP